MGAPDRKLNISVKEDTITVTRGSVGQQRLCYVVTANKIIEYSPRRRSKIVYIGTTKRGIERLASSLAEKAETILKSHGITRFEVHVVFSRDVQNVEAWRKLERALLLAFKDVYGAPPKFNIHGKGMVETDEFDYFSRDRINNVLSDLG